MANESANFTIPDTSTSISMSEGDEKPVVANANATTLDSNDPKKELPEDVSTHQADDGGDGEGGDGGDGEETAGELEDLGDFNGDDDEVVAKFDERYLDGDGDIDLEGSISEEYWANAAAGKEGLNEATYAYLKAKGIKASTIKQVEAMAKTQKDAEAQSIVKHDEKLFTLAGGPDKLTEALEWGKKGGYTPEQQARFNKATKGTDLAAKEEAVEALMNRFARANPTAKPRIPARDATKGQGQPTVTAKPFKDRAEMKAARDALGDQPATSPGWVAFNRRRAISNL